MSAMPNPNLVIVRVQPAGGEEADKERRWWQLARGKSGDLGRRPLLPAPFDPARARDDNLQLSITICAPQPKDVNTAPACSCRFLPRTPRLPGKGAAWPWCCLRPNR